MTSKSLPIVGLAWLAVGLTVSACDRDHRRSHEVEISGDHDREHHHRHRRHHYDAGDGEVSLVGDEVVIRAGGQTEDAHVGSDGSLRIGEQTVEVNAAGHAALQRYNAESFAIKAHALEIGRAGVRFGFDTARDALLSLFDGSSDAVEEKANQGASALKDEARQLCERVATVYASQQTAAEEAPQFKPYAILSKRQVEDCTKELDDDEDHDHSDESAPHKAA